VNLRSTKTQLPVQYLRSAACCRTSFLYWSLTFEFQVHGSAHLKQWEFLSHLMILLFDTFTHTLRVSGIYHPSSGATLQIGAVGITTCNIIYIVLVYIVIVVNGFFRGKGELVSVIDIENWCVVLILMCLKTRFREHMRYIRNTTHNPHMPHTC
jgi:hypothetical protein